MNTFAKFEDFTEPFLLNQSLDWEILKWDIDKWNDLLKSEELEFRMGKSKHTQEPQWENTCERIKGTFHDFLEFSKNDNNSGSWLYFDYKYLNNTFVKTDELRNCINWDKIIGLSGKTCDDSVIWIGNKGAHTPCHMDTYGCNFVAQIYGRKLWLLFPPNQNLRPTRVPYEESSIYSKINFYSPTSVEDFKDISQCRATVLEPGQVLFVPKGWWHYVENLEIAISINIWMPLPTDHERRIEEAITLALVTSLTSSMSVEEKRKILNSHELELLSVEASLKYIDHFVEKYKEFKAKDIDVEESKPLEKRAMVEVNELDRIEFLDLLKKQSQRFAISKEKEDSLEEKDDSLKEKANSLEETKTHQNIISAFTDPDVVELIKIKLLEK